MSTSVSQKIQSGLLWNFGVRAIVKVVSLGVGILLARILAPKDFGIVAVALMVWEMIALLGNLGLGAKLIHQQENVDEYANATFWIHLLVAAVIGTTAVIISPFAARFYENPIIQPIVQILGVGFLLSAFGNTHNALLQKQMAFKTLSLLELGLTLMKDVIAVSMVLTGFGLWSLVLPELFVRPVRIFALWKIVSWRPSFKLGLKYWKDIIDFGKFILGTTLLRYLNINGDYLIIGKVLGTGPLGLYQFAYDMANWPVQNIIWVFSKVLFPAYSKLQDNLKELQETYLKVAETLSIIAFPMLLGLLAVCDLAIPLVYGEKWRPAILPLKIIIAFTTVRTVATLGGSVLRAIGQPDKEFKLNAAQVVPLLAAVFIGSKFGIVGVAIGMSVVLCFFAVLFIIITNRAIGLKFSHIMQQITPAMLSSIAMLFVVKIVLDYMIRQQMGDIQTLLLAVFCGTFTYPLLMLIFFRKASNRFYGRFKGIFSSVGESLKVHRMRFKKT